MIMVYNSVAFQIMDDMDYSLSPDDMGKNSGDDFLDQKILAVDHRLWRWHPERQFWQRTVGNGAFVDGDFEEACVILQRHNAIDRSVAEAEHYASAAETALKRIAVQNNATPALLKALSEAAPYIARSSRDSRETSPID